MRTSTDSVLYSPIITLIQFLEAPLAAQKVVTDNNTGGTTINASSQLFANLQLHIDNTTRFSSIWDTLKARMAQLPGLPGWQYIDKQYYGRVISSEQDAADAAVCNIYNPVTEALNDLFSNRGIRKRVSLEAEATDPGTPYVVRADHIMFLYDLDPHNQIISTSKEALVVIEGKRPGLIDGSDLGRRGQATYQLALQNPNRPAERAIFTQILKYANAFDCKHVLVSDGTGYYLVRMHAVPPDPDKLEAHREGMKMRRKHNRQRVWDEYRQTHGHWPPLAQQQGDIDLDEGIHAFRPDLYCEQEFVVGNVRRVLFAMAAEALWEKNYALV
ncbi:hypothetical protein CALVIDRAFT_542929 [Calocera viscosa TUFC12733]|uniref:Uncharacterized protein n=1 Tax=Calocera viscosa (strain TUFC12733) TaxID=1330018 RepID=A0A167G581_CALVF|nr:hypothetical protein CALVIDRAFT_542929 [Calocera viscosa TUFC12733]